MKKFLYLITLIIIVIPASSALFHPGYFGASDDIHIAWLSELHQTVITGQIPPRFVPDLSYGFGYPLFNFVYPLPYYLGEIVHLGGLSFTYAVKAVFLLSLLLSALAMYRLLRDLFPVSASLLGAAVYVYTPYRSTDIYVRGAVGEAFAFVFLPLIALSMQRLASRRWVVIGGLSVAGLILTHDITAYMFLPFVFLLGLMMSAKKTLPKLVLVYLIGLAVSAYFWLPALLDSRLMHYSTVFNFLDHFPTLLQLFRPYWGYGASVPGPYDGMSFFLGWANIISLAVGVGVFAFLRSRLNRSQKILFLWSLVSFVIAFFMMNFRSAFLWSHVPLLPYFQFPWRFLIITTFSTSIMSAYSLFLLRSRVLILLCIIPLAVFSLPVFMPHDFLPRDDDYFLNRYVPVPVASPAYKLTQEEYLRLPLDTSVRPTQNYPRVYPLAAVSGLQLTNSLSASFDTSSASAQTLNYSKYYFPGWIGTLDNKPLSLSPGLPYGQISFTVPPGLHHIQIYFMETPFKIFLDLLSLGGLVIALLSLLRAKN